MAVTSAAMKITATGVMTDTIMLTDVGLPVQGSIKIR